MTRGWHVRVTRSAAVPCTLLVLLAACTPAARTPSGLAAAAGVAPAESNTGPLESGRSYAFGQMLSREQQRNAALQEQLAERGRQIEQLQAQAQQLRQQAEEMRATLDQGATGGGGAAAAAQVARSTAPPEAEPERQGPGRAAAPQAQSEGEAPPQNAEQAEPAVVASLRTALTQEQERRQAVETELERLKEETSTPALADTGDPTAELAAARSQLTELRDALAEEHVERERMADRLRELQQRAAHAPQPEATSDNAELQARVESLRAEKEAAMESFNRSLAASQQRTAELERQLATSQVVAASAVAAAAATGAPAEGETAAIQAENAALRARLDEEHRRTANLAAKLRVATRVTDLIFKMQAQQAQAQPPPAR